MSPRHPPPAPPPPCRHPADAAGRWWRGGLPGRDGSAPHPAASTPRCAVRDPARMMP
ncbi:hypothetical protein HMPREF0731_2959 [Pseudoroseomonas cervicalis ATCC 49957]|uniref:Uncharacterized protein n=1 Tax=Pseudoroseomonas cervicalis ATCC 49957 TaxID=525371 RepID=D5RPE8_9PROT|nr:hypothetical protein HMPREF0731_2959 [Pseudoroseomonas cervicalis ATCC 49957]